MVTDARRSDGAAVIDRDRYRAAREACRKASSDLFFASHFTARPRRYALYAIDAVVRQLEEIMGPPQVGSGPAPAVVTTDAQAGSCCGGGCDGESIGKRRDVCLAVIDHLYSGQPTGKPDLDAFLDVNAGTPLPRTWWQTMIEGMATERTLPRYATWKRVSEVLGHVGGMRAFLSARVLRSDKKFVDVDDVDEDGSALWSASPRLALLPLTSSEDSARQRHPVGVPSAAASQLHAWGLAMRWCDALHHVKQDIKHGRLLLPLDDLVKHKLSERDLAGFAERGTTNGDPRWLELMSFELDRVRNLLRGGARAMSGFDNEGAKRSFAAVGVFALRRLEQLVAAGGDPFATEVKLSTWQRLKAMPRAVRVVWEATVKK